MGQIIPGIIMRWMAGQAASDDAATQYAARPEDFFAKAFCSVQVMPK